MWCLMVLPVVADTDCVTEVSPAAQAWARYLTVALRLDTLSSIALSFAFKRGSLKYPN